MTFFPFRYIDRSKFYQINEITSFETDIQIIGLIRKKEKDLFDSPIRRFPDVSKALKITSFKYKHDLELGLKKTFDWYKTNIFKK